MVVGGHIKKPLSYLNERGKQNEKSGYDGNGCYRNITCRAVRYGAP